MSVRSDYADVIRDAERRYGAVLVQATRHARLLMPDGTRIPIKRGSKMNPHSAAILRRDLERWAAGKDVGLGRNSR